MTFTPRARTLLRLSPIGVLLAVIAFVITALVAGANRADADPAILANLQHAAEHGTHGDGPMLHVMAAPTPAGRDVTAPSSTATLYDRADLAQDPFAEPVSAADGPRLAEVGYTPAGTSHLSVLTRHVDPACVGTGADGNRVQVIYARESGATDRFAAVEALLRNEIAGVDDVFAASSAETGGGKRVRWVTDANCVPVIDRVVLPTGSLNDFTATKNALKAAGYTSGARKYLVFAEASRLCGIGDMYLHEAKTGNYNDGGYAMYSRVDTGCWATGQDEVSTAAHEVMHNLGAVQNNAPNTTRAGHCTDNGDLMCYADGSGVPMRQVCSTNHEPLFDCNHDDYFSTNPPTGSYLATNWNAANSTFLTTVAALPVAPPVTITGPDTGYAGQSFTLTATATGATGYEWFAPGATTPTATGPTATFTAPYAGTRTYKVRALFGETASVATHTINLTQAPAPTVTIQGPDTVEVNKPFTFTATATGVGPMTYDWSDLRNFNCTIIGSATDATVTASCPAAYPSRTVYVYVLVRSADGQYGSAQKPVQVTVPAMTVSVSASPTSLAVGQSGTATVQVGNVPAGWSATWSDERGWLQNASATSATFTAKTAGTNRITVTVQDGSGMQMQTASAVVTAAAAPTATVTGPTSLTVNRAGAYTVTVKDGTAASVTWVSANGWLTGSTTSTSATLTPKASGTDTLTATVQLTDGRTLTATYKVTAVKEAVAFSATNSGTHPVAVTGALVNKATGKAIANAPVVLQVKWYGTSTWATLSTGYKTDAYGKVTYKASAARAGQYAFVYPGDATTDRASAISPLVKMPSKVALSVKSGYPTYLTGTLLNSVTGKPFAAGQPVTLKVKWYGTSTWSTVTTGLRTDAYGRVVYKTSLTRGGYFQMSHGGSTSVHGSSTSAPLVQAATKMSMAVKAGRPNYLTGRLMLGNGAYVKSTYVTLQYRYAGSSTWRTVANYKTSTTGYATAKVQPKRATYYRWVYNGASATLLGSTSPQGYVKY